MRNCDLWIMRVSVVVIAVLGFICNGFAETPREQIKNTTEQQQKKPVATPATFPFTELQLQKLNRYLDTKGQDASVRPEYSRLLGLSQDNETIIMRKAGGKDKDGVRHLFGRLQNGAGYYLGREISPEETRSYWVGSDFKVIAAVYRDKDHSLSALPPADAEDDLRGEYATWAKHADAL